MTSEPQEPEDFRIGVLFNPVTTAKLLSLMDHLHCTDPQEVLVHLIDLVYTQKTVGVPRVRS